MTVQYQSHQAFVVLIILIYIIEFINPHYNEGDSGSNPDGRSLHIYACSVNSLIIKIIFFGGTASASLSLPWEVFLWMILERAASEHVLMRIFLASRLSLLG